MGGEDDLGHDYEHYNDLHHDDLSYGQDHIHNAWPSYDLKKASAASVYPPFLPPLCPDVCDLSRFKKCTCLTPATFTKDGRGNCNVGASKMDLRVWCYIDTQVKGRPDQFCPDAIPSKSKKGLFWSRIACITPS